MLKYREVTTKSFRHQLTRHQKAAVSIRRELASSYFAVATHLSTFFYDQFKSNSNFVDGLSCSQNMTKNSTCSENETKHPDLEFQQEDSPGQPQAEESFTVFSPG